MAIPTQPNRFFPRPFAQDGNFQNIIPDTGATTGRASYSLGFPTETQLPIASGGIAPNRLDFNGLFNILTAFGFWQQSGGQWTYHTSLNYVVPCIVFYGGKLYWCLQANGPDASGGVVTPGTNEAYWLDLAQALLDQAGIVIGGSGTANRKQVFTTSQSFTAPATGPYKVTCIGGGGGGGRGGSNSYGGSGGASGGATSFGSFVTGPGGGGGGGGGAYIPDYADGGAGGGGASGGIAFDYVNLTEGQIVTITIGIGGSGGLATNSGEWGGNGAGTYFGYGARQAGQGGGGAPGAGNGGVNTAYGNTEARNRQSVGGAGGINGSGYGGGGGGGCGADRFPSTGGGGAARDGGQYGNVATSGLTGGTGGAGGSGAVILEYYQED